MGYKVVKAGALTEAASIGVVKAGVLTPVTAVKVVDGGVLKLVWSAVDLSGVPSSISDNVLSGTAIAGYDINSDKTHEANYGGFKSPLSPDWTLSNASSYDVRATLDAGTTPTGSAVDTWLSMASNRSWTISRGTPGATTSTLTIEVRVSSTGTVAATTTTTLTAEFD